MIDYKDENGNFTVNSIDTMKKMRTMLSPTFVSLHKENKIPMNFLQLVDVPELDRHVELSPLNIRLKEQNYRDIVKKLYKHIQEIENERIRMYLLFTLMTMRRRGEVFQYTTEHISSDFIDATKDITKTEIHERFPIPDEVKQFLQSEYAQSAKYPLKVDVHDFGIAWHNMIDKAGIDYVQEFRFRDTRNLFMSIMSRKYNRELVGACISHFKGDINAVYNSFPYEERKEIFEEYWKILRDE